MKEIYIVTAGSYSDYGIIGAFSSKERANEYAEYCKENQRYSGINDLEIYEIDCWYEHLKSNRKLFYVTMDKNGDTTYAGYIGKGDESIVIRGSDMSLQCYANDKNHAVKIANEKRIQILAENRWEG